MGRLSQELVKPSPTCYLLVAAFLRSAQRFRMASAMRLRPSAESFRSLRPFSMSTHGAGRAEADRRLAGCAHVAGGQFPDRCRPIFLPLSRTLPWTTHENAKQGPL